MDHCHPRGFCCALFFLSQSVIAVCRSLVQHFLLFFSLLFSFPSIVQVPRITSVWPRTPFRPLFSAIQTASLLSSHPFEAAMFGVAGAMYYLFGRAFTSRWKPSKVGLFLLVLGLLYSLSDSGTCYTLQELTAQTGAPLLTADSNLV